MRKIIHISDLHFGRVDDKICSAILEEIASINPDVVVVSGDLTQRGRSKEYKEARNFLTKISCPKIVVPGNHDIPLFDIFSRFLMPLRRFKKYISEDLDPLYVDSELVVYGINTARSLTWKNGRISIEQIAVIEKEICVLSNEQFKILVTHHPFIPPPGTHGIALVGRSKKALVIIDKCGIDLLLAGHLHYAYSGDVRTYYPLYRRSVISLQAGTAISKRIRAQSQAFNTIVVERNRMEIEIFNWEETKFVSSRKFEYRKKGDEWITT
ncbi:MAG: metallophosphoesterase family protein [Syntrophothermus sp.]